ncbi:BQ5605_C139g13420 [Microbotryum silenes-dioicae]|uniref:BQ5605_C139g13420 protein n=1 Tax=Microbotryum silenes-dioicae TaxID=796604 RepID=A0A2X0MHR9_9BASI|nr:BQ5605_C139g13420 [Microbotryum silenes-dioicae]
MAPHPNATSSLRHLKRSSWKLCNEYGIKNGRIDFVRLRIRVIGTLNILNGSVRWSDRCGGRDKQNVFARNGPCSDSVRGNIRSCRCIIAYCCTATAKRQNGTFTVQDPIDIFDDSTCNHRRCFQLLDRMLQHVRLSTARFGGLTVVMAVMACTNRRRLHHGMLAPGGKLRGYISWRILNGSVRWSDRDPKQCLPVIPRSLASWNADFWGGVEMDNSKNTDTCPMSRRSEGQQQIFFAEPCLYHINIDESFYFQRI